MSIRKDDNERTEFLNRMQQYRTSDNNIGQIDRWKSLEKYIKEKNDIRETATMQVNETDIPRRDLNRTRTDFRTTGERTAFLERMQDYHTSEEANVKAEEEIIEESIKEKRTLKNKVAKLLVIGTLVGPPAILVYNFAYNYGVNMPSPHNYRTVKEAREGVEHDPTNHIKYLEQKGFSKEEINKKLEQYENDR